MPAPATGAASCRYTELDAGRLTALVAPLARAFFAHRRRRWRALAAVLAPEDGAAWPA